MKGIPSSVEMELGIGFFKKHNRQYFARGEEMVVNTIVDITTMPFGYFCDNCPNLLNEIEIPEEIFDRCLSDSKSVIRIISIPLSKSYYIEIANNSKLFKDIPQRIKNQLRDVIFINNIVAETNSIVDFVKEKNIDAKITVLGDGMSSVTY